MTRVGEHHERYMRRCIELALLAREQGNTPVGSIVVLNDQIIGEGAEQLPTSSHLSGHAEVLACQRAVDRLDVRVLRGATLYSTAEPCFMCSYVIRQAEISQVVFGIETPVIGGVTSAHPILTDAGLSRWKPVVRAVGGILRIDCRRLRS